MNINQMNIGILGLGVSGYWAAKLASSFGAKVFVSDSKSDISDEYLVKLRDMGVDIELGNHSNKITEKLNDTFNTIMYLNVLEHIKDDKNEILGALKKLEYLQLNLKVYGLIFFQ